MTIAEAMKAYKLQNPTTQEDLETRWDKVLNYGDKVLVAGYYWNGPGEPSYFAAAYEYLDDEEEHDCESTIGIREVSDVCFYDDGHAIAWAMQQK